MDLRSPLRLSALVALAAGLSALAVLLGGAYLLGAEVDAVVGIAALIAVMGCTLVATYVLVRRFVLQRVDLIHRMIHGTQAGDERPPVGGDPLGSVGDEVGAWAAAKRTEIRELKEREQYRREFIGNLAHELRTPIFSIQGYVLTLLEGGLEDAKVNRDFLSRASNGVDRLIRIVEDMDLITQLESGVLTLQAERLDLQEPVTGTIKALEMKAAGRRFTLRSRLEDGTWVRADRDRMQQVFTNLFMNAINYGREGGWCEVRAFDVGDRVLVEVADNGIGIAEEHLPRLFERFYRVGKSRARNEGGSGLGLAIVKHIVEAHGGTISVKSREGEGTTFRFTVPKSK
jgi:two-component system phosphate regulon sensor histidine kinase PhoR